MEEQYGPKAGNKVNSVNDMVRDYSSFNMEKSEQIQAFVTENRLAAFEASKWARIGAAAPNAPKSHMRHPVLEKYGSYAIDHGINNEMDTELNMSPEGKLRRNALVAKEEADKRFEEFGKKPEANDGKLNLSLKVM